MEGDEIKGGEGGERYVKVVCVMDARVTFCYDERILLPA